MPTRQQQQLLPNQCSFGQFELPQNPYKHGHISLKAKDDRQQSYDCDNLWSTHVLTEEVHR